MVLIGNKTDLATYRRIPTTKAKAYADENNMLYYEVSALDGTTDMEKLFIEICKYGCCHFYFDKNIL